MLSLCKTSPNIVSQCIYPTPSERADLSVPLSRCGHHCQQVSFSSLFSVRVLLQRNAGEPTIHLGVDKRAYPTWTQQRE